MDIAVQGSVSPKTDRKSPLPSPKRPRIDNTLANNDTSTYDLPELSTSQIVESPSLTSPRDVDQICAGQNGNIPDKQKCDQIQDTEVTTLNTPEVCVTTEKSHVLQLKKYDQLDKLSPCPLLESYTLDDSTPVMSGHPECQLLQLPVEDKHCLHSKNGISNDVEVKHQSDFSLDSDQLDVVLNTCCQSSAFDEPTGSESGDDFTDTIYQRGVNDVNRENDVEVRHQSHFSFDSDQLDAVFNTCCQSSAFDESTGNERGEDFTDTINQRGVSEVDRETSSHSHITEFKLLVPPPDENIPAILAEDKNNVDVCDSPAVCDWETDNQANNKGTREISSIEFKEVSPISYHTPPAKYIATETGNLDDFNWARGDHGETVAKTQKEGVDHMSENHMSAMITVKSAERDNDAVPCRVIELAVCSETVREAEGNCCNSKNAAVEALPPSVIVSELEIPLPPTSDVRLLYPTLDQTVHSPCQSKPEEHEDETEKLIECCSVPSSGKHNTPGYEGTCHLTSSPSISPRKPTKPLPAGDGRQHSCGSLGHHLEEQSGCSPVSCDHLKARDVENSLLGADTKNKQNDIKEMKVEMRSNEIALKEDKPNNEDKTELPLNEGLNEGTELTPGDEVEYKPRCFSEYQQAEEILECKDELFAVSFPPFSDAVVPGPHELTPRTSQKVDCSLAQNSNDIFSPVPSVFATYTRFDNFHKIQLSPEYDDDGQRNCCSHTSLTMQLIKSPQMEHFQLKADDEHEERSKVTEEDQINEHRVECHTEDFANEGFNIDINSNKFGSWEDTAIELPNNASGNNEPPPDSIQCLEFKMKKEFDLVLKELNLYFDICKSEIASKNGTPPEQCGDVLKSKVSNSTTHLISEELALHREPTLDPEEDSINMHVTEPEACHITSHRDEQEVPIDCEMSTEASSLFAEKHKEPQPTELKRTAWLPSFMYPPQMQGQSHIHTWEAKRLEPLRTCRGPLRLGLSKRAKPRGLHRFHPYK
ncbi:uncharacterized protein LOC130907584 [Corythoichthys intestinalis]|uniref:uncharacterized protein LOC130907584 n=1 Tax=Corythoichthys intestinalis TaxID=161448 RepID=UPI0025A514A2|nr:uncharacterized protein LOC130907584 [Corythoichthys intestinalis]